jgi:hypothetical protein
MQTQMMSRTSTPMAPCCRHCYGLMSFKEAQPWTLLRGQQLDRLTFECDECGYTVSRLVGSAG